MREKICWTPQLAQTRNNLWLTQFLLYAETKAIEWNRVPISQKHNLSNAMICDDLKSIVIQRKVKFSGNVWKISRFFLFLLIIIVVSEADVWKQAIMNNKGQRIMVCSHEIYLYIFSRKKRKNIWPGYEFKLSSFSSTHIHWLPPMGPPNPIYELVIIQTCLFHITQITIAMQGLSSLTNTFYVFFLSCFSSIIHEYHCSESRRWILDLVQVMMGAEPYSFMIFFTKTNDDGS